MRDFYDINLYLLDFLSNLFIFLTTSRESRMESRKDAPDAASLVDSDDSSYVSLTNFKIAIDPLEDQNKNLLLLQQSSSLNTTVTSLLANTGMGCITKESISMTIMGVFGRSTGDTKDTKIMFPRRRLNTMPLDTITLDQLVPQSELSSKYDRAQFIPGYGLVNNYFWHSSCEGDWGTLFEERAILFQAMEHYDAILRDPTFGQYMKGEDIMTLSTFGEQVIVKGCDASKLAVGDVFSVEGQISTLVVEITSPRVPSYYIDIRHGAPVGLKGLRRHVLTRALGGWFARVLVAGELRDGMRLTRDKHPNPKYTLTYISKLLYSEGNPAILARSVPHWERGKRELSELSALPQLARFQWRNEVMKLLTKIEKAEQRYFLSCFRGNLRLVSRSFYSTPTLTVMGIFGRRDEPVVSIGKDRRGGTMLRRRLRTMPLNHGEGSLQGETTDNYDTAMFVSGRGLVDNCFWHDRHYRGIYEERAILFQSIENYNTISEDSIYGKYLENEDIMTEPTFGEQVIVKGCNTCNLSVGDVFTVEGGLSDLTVEISSPRLPCYHVDDRHRSPRGLKGMKRYTMTNALGGWFTRVIKWGELRDGMSLIRTEHPNPKFTLTYVSTVLYTEGDRRKLALCQPHWNRSKSELIKLINVPQLGRHEWKEEAENLLAVMNKKK